MQYCFTAWEGQRAEIKLADALESKCRSMAACQPGQISG
jgi:hypothetical protein